MTEYRATPEQWEYQEKWGQRSFEPDIDSSCLLELRARIEALEAAQLEQAESNRFCTDAIVRRVEVLEAFDHRPLLAAVRAQSKAVAHFGNRLDALEAAQQDKLDRLIALDRDDPTPDAAMTELRAASAEARPAGGLVERVEEAIITGMVDGDRHAARAAIREVAKWLDTKGQHGCSLWLREEADRG